MTAATVVLHVRLDLRRFDTASFTDDNGPVGISVDGRQGGMGGARQSKRRRRRARRAHPESTTLVTALVGLCGVAVFAAHASAYYHPGLGRFIQRDPIGYGSRDLNLYAYVSGRPATFVDATGMRATDIFSVSKVGYEKGSARHKKCVDEVDAAIDNFQDEAKRMVERKCGKVNIRCLCCDAKENIDDFPKGMTSKYVHCECKDPKNPKLVGGVIFICEDRGEEGIARLARHEMVHAYDDCFAGAFKKGASCEAHFCSEIRAYLLSGQCDPRFRDTERFPRELSVKECVIGRAMRSVTLVRPDCREKLRGKTEDLWDKCSLTPNPLRRPFPPFPEGIAVSGDGAGG